MDFFLLEGNRLQLAALFCLRKKHMFLSVRVLKDIIFFTFPTILKTPNKQ